MSGVEQLLPQSGDSDAHETVGPIGTATGIIGDRKFPSRTCFRVAATANPSLWSFKIVVLCCAGLLPALVQVLGLGLGDAFALTLEVRLRYPKNFFECSSPLN